MRQSRLFSCLNLRYFIGYWQLHDNYLTGFYYIIPIVTTNGDLWKTKMLLSRFPIKGGYGMIYFLQIRLWKKRIRKYQSAVVLNRITALFISTKIYINSNNFPIYCNLIISAPVFRRVCFFNVRYRRYLSLSSGRSPPSVLIPWKIKTEVETCKEP